MDKTGQEIYSTAGPGVRHYVRFRRQGRVAYGLVRGDQVYELKGGLFDGPTETGLGLARTDVELLAPCEPTKILGLGWNYASHLAGRPRPQNPEMFFVPPSAALRPGGTIVIPADTARCECEGEMVVVIGKEATKVPVDRAGEYVFGVTCGNDVSARDWQKNDLQWWRAKGCDTFAPFGPVLAQGLPYHDLLLTTRVNGQVTQQQRTSDLIFGVHQILSFVSRYVTLLPGDLIYTGTPGMTAALASGDLVEVELEGVGVLRNEVTQA